MHVHKEHYGHFYDLDKEEEAEKEDNEELMTREEAIEEIKRWTPILLVSGQCTEKTSKAQDMAISALSENKGDLISRQAVIDALTKTSGIRGDALKALYDLPSVENKGEWIADVDKWGDVVTTVNGYTCSKCGMFNSDKDNFCPNCGADMRGE